jgi:hypothetical protein
MLRRLTQYFTLGALLTHLLLGCCWHHAHGCATQLASADHDDHPCGSHEQPGTRHHDQHLCQQAKCVFIRSTHGELTVTPRCSWPAPALTTPGVDLTGGRFPGPSFLPACAAVRTLRVHLVHQILLI